MALINLTLGSGMDDQRLYSLESDKRYRANSGNHSAYHSNFGAVGHSACVTLVYGGTAYCWMQGNNCMQCHISTVQGSDTMHDQTKWGTLQLYLIHVTFQHVESHKDNGQITILLQLAWMNIEMDEDGRCKVLVDGPKEQLSRVSSEGWVCSIKGKQITSHLTMSLQNISMELHF